MQGVASKLSKHVLGMKFMSRTKDQLDKTHVEQKHREHFSSDVKPNSTSSFKKLETIVEEVPSYSQCIGYKFGRLSFGGFNPTVEYNVRKRNWKAAHVGEVSSDDGESDEEEDVKPKPEMDVDDEEMAETYGSIIGTVGRQLMDRNEDKPKGRRNKWRKRDQPAQTQEGTWGTSHEIELNPSSGGGWTKKGFRSKGKKSKNLSEAPSEPSSSKYTKSWHHDEDDSHSKSRRPWQKKGKKEKDSAVPPPPQKKRKFMKPSEDDY